MAHSCPECGYACHCGGDIDDIILEGTEEEYRCTCCAIQEHEDFEDPYDDYIEGYGEE